MAFVDVLDLPIAASKDGYAFEHDDDDTLKGRLLLVIAMANANVDQTTVG